MSSMATEAKAALGEGAGTSPTIQQFFALVGSCKVPVPVSVALDDTQRANGWLARFADDSALEFTSGGSLLRVRQADEMDARPVAPAPTKPIPPVRGGKVRAAVTKERAHAPAGDDIISKVHKVRELDAKGWSNKAIAEAVGWPDQKVSAVRRGKAYAHIA